MEGKGDGRRCMSARDLRQRARPPDEALRKLQAEIAVEQGRGFDMSRILERGAEALMGLDAEALVALYADEFLLEDVASGMRITTREELRGYYERLFSMAGVRFTDVSFFTCGDRRAAGQWTWSGKSMKSGQDFSIVGSSLFRLTEDRISEEKLFYNPTAALA